jgi:hypothetical protein
MKTLYLLVAAAVATGTAVADEKESVFQWNTVINNNDLMPFAQGRTFNSYNPPSVNTRGMVVVRARSRGGPPLGPATHGIYTRDMGEADSEIVRLLDRTTLVPGPNNLGTTFVETPSFPRIDMHSNMIATRGNHQPVYNYYLDDGSETRAGTTGIYTNPYGDLMMGTAKLGHVPGFGFLGVPEQGDVTFEVFPGAPSVASGNIIAFKGNYSADGTEKTGVYFRHVLPEPAERMNPSIMIANTDTLIPGTTTFFGSTAPPNAADRKVVFAGFDDEQNPSMGGIYLAPLQYMPRLTTLVSIYQDVPGNIDGRFNALGEGIAFDGRYVGFWGAWGEESREIKLYCPTEGNKDRRAYCNKELVCVGADEPIGDPGSICDDTGCYQLRDVPVDQGIFVHDTRTKRTHLLAKTGEDFDDFLFWNYAGKAPCTGGGHHDGGEEGGEEDGESVRWRSSAYLAVSPGIRATFRSVFKARTADVVGIYLREGPGLSPFLTVADTTMDGQLLDPEAPPDSTIVEVGIEREGLRGDWLAINAKMGVEGGEEEDDMAGIYITKLDRRTCCRAPAAK